MKSSVLASVFAIAAALPAPASALEPPIDTRALSGSRYARMHMLLERTFLNIDVIEVDVRFGAKTERRLRELAEGHRFSRERAARIASAAMQAREALIVVRFERDVSRGRFFRGVRENLGSALEAGLIDRAAYRRALRRVSSAFSFLKGRGFKEGDHLVYRARPESLRTVVVTAQGKTLLDRTDETDAPRRTLLASYFAPGTDFREPLIRSLF